MSLVINLSRKKTNPNTMCCWDQIKLKPNCILLFIFYYLRRRFDLIVGIICEQFFLMIRFEQRFLPNPGQKFRRGFHLLPFSGALFEEGVEQMRHLPGLRDAIPNAPKALILFLDIFPVLANASLGVGAFKQDLREREIGTIIRSHSSSNKTDRNNILQIIIVLKLIIWHG